jgi:hypothetical protein
MKKRPVFYGHLRRGVKNEKSILYDIVHDGVVGFVFHE